MNCLSFNSYHITFIKNNNYFEINSYILVCLTRFSISFLIDLTILLHFKVITTSTLNLKVPVMSQDYQFTAFSQFPLAKIIYLHLFI